MEIPRKLTIRGATWKVRLVSGFAKRTGQWGLCNYSKQVITLDRGMSDHAMGVTFIHEVLHAIWPDGVVENEVEEKLINILDRRLFATLKKNKII